MISIHTLTWRVTETAVLQLNILNISIHTLTWRVTDPRTFLSIGMVISIHTLTWRVTYILKTGAGSSVDFNPHPHVEGD